MKQEQNNRTLFIATSSWNSNNPVSQQFQCLAEKLAEQGNKVIVLVPKNRGKITSQETNLEVLFWPSKRPTKLSDA